MLQDMEPKFIITLGPTDVSSTSVENRKLAALNNGNGSYREFVLGYFQRYPINILVVLRDDEDEHGSNTDR